MYVRVTPYQLKPGMVEKATAHAETLKPKVMALPGMMSFINAVNADGKGYILATVSDRATSEANADKVRAIWGEMAPFLAEMPTPEGYDVVAHWEN